MRPPCRQRARNGVVLTAFPTFRTIFNTQEKTSLAAAGGRGFVLPENGETVRVRSTAQAPGCALPAAQEGFRCDRMMGGMVGI